MTSLSLGVRLKMTNAAVNRLRWWAVSTTPSHYHHWNQQRRSHYVHECIDRVNGPLACRRFIIMPVLSRTNAQKSILASCVYLRKRTYIFITFHLGDQTTQNSNYRPHALAIFSTVSSPTLGRKGKKKISNIFTLDSLNFTQNNQHTSYLRLCCRAS